MKRSRLDKEYSLRFMTLRALVVIALVMAALMGLKWGRVIVPERDVPVQVVEEITRESSSQTELLQP